MNKISEIFSESQLKTLEQDNPTPLYFRLYTLLKNAILDGTIEKGAQMPTEQQLADTFSVSRITAKRAMDELAAEDMVERHRGKGTHVTYEYKPQPVKAPLIGMLQEIESMARHTDVKVLECKKLVPPGDVRDALGLPDKEKALHLIRVRSRDGQPFGYYSSWTIGLHKPVGKKDFKKSPRLEIFRRQGLKITHITQTISAIAASPALAEQLNTATGAPLISLLRESFTSEPAGERLVDHLHACYNPDHFQYRMDLDINSH
ncbi:MAG: GntR family transcriptional regulator [Halieaceae bacterium]|jgi:GntR family transcriptional regulator